MLHEFCWLFFNNLNNGACIGEMLHKFCWLVFKFSRFKELQIAFYPKKRICYTNLIGWSLNFHNLYSYK